MYWYLVSDDNIFSFEVFFNQISRQNISSSRWLEESLRILEILIRSKSCQMNFLVSWFCFCDFLFYFEVLPDSVVCCSSVPPSVWTSCPSSVFSCVLFVSQHCVYIVCVLPDVFVSSSCVSSESLLVSSTIFPCHVSVIFVPHVFSWIVLCSSWLILCFSFLCFYFVFLRLTPLGCFWILGFWFTQLVVK